MEYSSGIILYRWRKEDGEAEFFVCTPDGPYWENRELWNFPKGHLEENETPFETALREFKEETNLSLDPYETHYCFHGKIQQNKRKIVYVFSREWWGEDTSCCFSNNTTTEYNGKIVEHAEIKDYRWMTYSELVDKGMKCYLPIFKEINNGFDCQE